MKKENGLRVFFKSLFLAGLALALFLPSVDADTVIGDLYVSGRLGIGAEEPLESLDVQGEAPAIRLGNARMFAGGDNQNVFQFLDGMTGYEIMRAQRLYGAVKVGIGTSAPASTLHVYSLSPGITIEPQPQANGGNGGYLLFRDVGCTTGASVSYSFPDSRIAFGTAEGQFLLVAKTDTGHVGIGTTNPEVRLHVVGDAQIDGSLTVEYQDVAEWVKSAEKLESGQVVVIDVENDNQVVLSIAPYNTLIAGMVSKKPGLVLGEKGEDKYQIAHSGRVMTRVTASNGPICRGDLLVTSSLPGTAMRSEPFECHGRTIHEPGTVLGRALEDWIKGEGEILALISL